MQGDVIMENGKSSMVLKGGPDSSSMVDTQTIISKLVQGKKEYFFFLGHSITVKMVLCYEKPSFVKNMIKMCYSY